MSILEGILLESDTKKQLVRYLSKVSGGLVLLGDKGIGKSLCARDIACSILSCTDKELGVHPDYFFTEPDDGTVRMEQIQVLRAKSNLTAATSEKKVFVINEADTMSIQAQNAILKLLEDGNSTNILIFITDRALLPTIHSRTTTINFKNPTVDDLRRYIEDKGEKVSDLALAMSDGKLGLYYRIISDKDLVRDLEAVIKTLNTMNKKRELLEIFHELKEKDKSNFFESHDSYIIEAFVKVLKEVFTDLLCYRYGLPRKFLFMDYDRLTSMYSKEQNVILAEVLNMHLEQMQKKGAYNKNDFFALVRTMVLEL